MTETWTELALPLEWSPEQSAAYVMDAWQQAVESIIETGRRLIEVRERTRHGEWDAVIKLLPFDDSTCVRLMKVARHPLLSNPAHAQDLPASWYTLYALTRLSDLDERLERGDINAALERKEVERWLSEQAKGRFDDKLAAWHVGANMAGERWEIRLGDFRDELADVEPGSVDAIVTDPPYPDEFLPLWSDVAAFAAKALRPGAPLIAWTGQYRLPQVLNALEEHLIYGWTLLLDLPGINSRVFGKNIIQTWKPIVLFTAGTWGPHEWQQDRVVSPKQDQALYEWQQHPDPAVELMERYVAPSGLVVDPFTGVGSFGVAALNTGRRFLGTELDETRAGMAASRLKEAAP